MKLYVVIFLACCFSIGLSAQGLEEIKLLTPDKTRGSSMMQAFANRHSDRVFANKKLSVKDLSDLLWAANGVNRADKGMRTAPSALNKQDIDVYVVLAEGAYLYDAKAHTLKPVAKGDYRPLLAGGQDFVNKAPACLLLVSDLSRFGEEKEYTRMMAAMDAGIVSQNINLFCAGAGLSTVPRASMDQAGLRKALKLKDSQIPLMNNPVGYPVK